MTSSAKRRKRNVIVVSIIIFLALAVAAGSVIILMLSGETFTGRVGLWEWFIKDLGDRIFIGAGGMTAPADPMFVQRAEASGRAITSDSSYIMLLYNQGIIGVLLFFGVIAFLWQRCLRIGTWYIGYCLTTIATYMVFAFVESDARLGPAPTLPTMILLIQIMILEKLWTENSSSSSR